MDKYEMISNVITKVDSLMEAKGIAKAVLGVEIVQQLNALAKGLGDEDKAHEREKKLLEEQLTPPLKEGETRVGGETVHFDLSDLEAMTNGKDHDAE